jgi:hypothetical protein
MADISGDVAGLVLDMKKALLPKSSMPIGELQPLFNGDG